MGRPRESVEVKRASERRSGSVAASDVERSRCFESQPGLFDDSGVHCRRTHKRIIGVWALGTTQGDLRVPLADFADAIVGWDAEAIIDALNGTDTWQAPDGSTGPEREISLIGC